MTVRYLWHKAGSVLVECLESLPNLHTLEIWLADYCQHTPLLKDALKGVKLPQIKTLVLPPVAHLLVEHCPNVEDVDWVTGGQTVTSSEFLASIQHSKIKRLAIPLVSPGDPSRE